jgi:hypothetical protein
MDLRKSKAVSLILIGSVAVFFGFKTCYSHYDGGDDDYDRTYYADPTTRPVHRSSGSHYFWGGSRSRGYRAGSSIHSGTSRGGFGASGHAAGS